MSLEALVRTAKPAFEATAANDSTYFPFTTNDPLYIAQESPIVTYHFTTKKSDAVQRYSSKRLAAIYSLNSRGIIKETSEETLGVSTKTAKENYTFSKPPITIKPSKIYGDISKMIRDVKNYALLGYSPYSPHQKNYSKAPHSPYRMNQIRGQDAANESALSSSFASPSITVSDLTRKTQLEEVKERQASSATNGIRLNYLQMENQKEILKMEAQQIADTFRNGASFQTVKEMYSRSIPIMTPENDAKYFQRLAVSGHFAIESGKLNLAAQYPKK